MNKAWTWEKPLPIFIQINSSGEEGKGGMSPQECTTVAEHIVRSCTKLNFCGVMTIGAFDRDPNQPNPDFLLLVECAQKVSQHLGRQVEISMGMSEDFELAIEMGSTNVRVGSKIFGERIYPKKD